MVSEATGDMAILSRKRKRTSGAEVRPDKKERLDESHDVPLASKGAKVRKTKAKAKAKRPRKELRQDLGVMASRHFVQVNKKEERVEKK